MIGLILLLTGALIIGMTMDAAVDLRLSMGAVHMAEERIRSELVAESMLELAVSVVRNDTDLSFDTLRDSWTDTIHVPDFAYTRYVSVGVIAVIIDLERYPPEEVISLLGISRDPDAMIPEHGGLWLNVMTAPPESWRVLGFSRDASIVLGSPDSWGNGTEMIPVGFESMETHDRVLLDRLLSMDALRKRSELFLVRIDTLAGVYSAVLHRSPVSGTVHLRSFSRTSA